MAPSYQGIVFPDRAERISEFAGYRVFLDHWNDLSARLGEMFEGVSLRGESRILAVHGEQGRGKTLFANQLGLDFEASKNASAGAMYNENNLWHRIAGGLEGNFGLVQAATNRAECILIEDDPGWVGKLVPRLAGNRDRTYIIIADNAERSYFRQGLVNLSVGEYLAAHNSPEFLTMVAQRLVHLCRTDMARCVFVVLSNDDIFLLNLDSAVEKQHEGLLHLMPLPVPGAKDKETIVRINTNRLNKISYWYCLDKAGPVEKKAVYSALSGADSFPASFKAVNTAIRQATPTRIGRPAKKNVISLLAIGNTEDVSFPFDRIGEVDNEEISTEWLKVVRVAGRRDLSSLRGSEVCLNLSGN